jgi:nicotinamide mononucleotide transporter
MTDLFNFLFEQYQGYENSEILLEAVAVFLGILSVWFARANSILVYPTGIISTGIFVYLLYQWGLVGDMIINAYYFSMSVYGWYVWTRKVDPAHFTPIARTNKKEKIITVFILIAALICIPLIYMLFNKWNSTYAYVDTITTAIFFAAMWLMARRKIENWIWWIVGDIISIPLYFLKGYTLTSFQYLVFLGLAIWGYYNWRKLINEQEAKQP